MNGTVSLVATPTGLDGESRVERARVGGQQVGVVVREHGWSRTVADEFDRPADELDAGGECHESHPEMRAVVGRNHRVTAARRSAA